MNVFRGPKTKPFYSDTHELVAKVAPKSVETSISTDSARIQFNVTKDGFDRQSVCTLVLDDEDLIAMLRGLLIRFERQQNALAKVRVTLGKSLPNEVKLKEISKAIG
jgi:hypothetical protein